MKRGSIPSTEEAWESGLLGGDEKFMEAVDAATAEKIDEAAGTQLISIRMQKSTIEDLKLIASLNSNIGYQTLIKQVLQRFIDCEKKQLLREIAFERRDKASGTPIKNRSKVKSAVAQGKAA